jgi:general stress protein 26
MRQEILDYLKTQRVGVLALEMMDGSPHGATVHFAHNENPLIFYFETNREYRKSEALFGREKTRATFVVGVDEKIPKTMQLDGVVELLKPEEMATFTAVYLSKFPEKNKKVEDPKKVLFKFTPTWWRFTDWTKPKGKAIITSQN